MNKAEEERKKMARKKKQKLLQQKAQKEMLLKRVKEAREQVLGHEQLAKVHSAYISILLKKLGATEDNAVTIKGEEVKEALEKYETRAKAAEGGFSLFYEVQGNEVQTEATTTTRKEENQS